jgi:hypothetical protein
MKLKYKVTFVVLFTGWCFAAPAQAQEQASALTPDVTQNPVLDERLARANTQLQEISESIAELDREIVELRTALSHAKDADEQDQLAKNLGAKAIRRGELQSAFEDVATGGEDLFSVKKAPDEKFNWQNALIEIFQPLITELKKITERPREIERLRSEQAFYQARIPAVESALKRIQKLKSVPGPGVLTDELQQLEQRWAKQLAQLKSQLSFVTFNLEERLNEGSIIDDSQTAIQEFFSGRGLNILLAFSAFVAAYSLFFYLNVLLRRMSKRGKRHRMHFLERLLSLLYQFFSLLIAVFAALAVLYFRGDWIVLGVVVLLLVGIAWTIRYSAPHFLLEIKIFLNMGPVREQERIVYNGIAWKVAVLNIHSILNNPWLRGGTLRLPIRTLAEYQSRPYNEDEPWFPTKENDYVLLDDGVYGKVLLQSPEQVLVQTLGAIKTYSVESFLNQNPNNLSTQGFLVLVEFGLDYSLQPVSLTEVRQRLESHVAEGFKKEQLQNYLKSFSVSFKEAGASSLNYLLMATFHGQAAEQYHQIKRTMQQLAVEACNLYGWTIPFNQLTVHTTSQL